MRKLHDFLVVKAHDMKVVMKVREQCFAGQWKDSPLHVRDSAAVGVPTVTYSESHNHSLSAEKKMANMVTMYNRFIAPNRRPDYLPPVTSSTSAVSTARTPVPATLVSSASAGQRKRKQKQSKWSMTGCADGSGHKNPTRWSEGHTTRAGCPTT